MDISEVEENLFALGEPKLHGGMCKSLSAMYIKVLGIFPDLEAAMPRSTSGIQALCSLHIALEKTKIVLQHCAECSKLYLAITGDSVVLKFEKARSALKDSLRRVEDIVPQTIGSQISDILTEHEGLEFSLNPLEKQVGDAIIGLLQQGTRFNDTNEFETFHQSASSLGISSSRTSLREKRALKKLIEKARMDGDKRKESIVGYLLNLTEKHSKSFRSDLSDDNDSQSSTPCSPTVVGSFDFRPSLQGSGQMWVPPEELRCPISLQLMYDPVIVASGQTYERICIEKWFRNGHNTCPKTRQELTHLVLTPNHCVKGLVVGWCEQNGIAVPDGPPHPVDLDCWRLPLSTVSIGSCKAVKVEVVAECEHDVFETYEDFLTVLESGDCGNKHRVVEKVRRLLKEDEEARMLMGADRFVEALLRFFESAVHDGNEIERECGAMALFNLAVNNRRNKEKMVGAGILPILLEMTGKSNSPEAATALYLNLSCLEQAKPLIGSSDAVSFLVHALEHETGSDALHALYHLSTCRANVPRLISSGIVTALEPFLDHTLTEKAIAVLINLGSTNVGREAIVSAGGLVSGLTTVLEVGEPKVQAQAVACLLVLCAGSEKCVEMVLEEGVIPSLVSVSVDGTVRGKEKAEKLLMLFRERRQRDPPAVHDQPAGRKMGRSWSWSWSFWLKNKSFSVNR